MKKYETAEMEIVKFDCEDVIATSGDMSGDLRDDETPIG